MRILTVNAHKGFTALNRRFILPELREAVRSTRSATLMSRSPVPSVFERHHGRPAKTYPARWPLLRLDRVYLRNARSHRPQILGNKPWPHLCDHLPLAVEVQLPRTSAKPL